MFQNLRKGWAEGKAKVNEQTQEKHRRKARRSGDVLTTTCFKSELSALLSDGWELRGVHSEAMSPRYTLSKPA